MLARAAHRAALARAPARLLGRKRLSFTTSGVPVLDIGEIAHAKDTSKLSPSMPVVRAIREACQEWGFFQVENHGVPKALVDAMYEQQEAFFKLPVEKKRLLLRAQDNSRGWFNEEFTKQKLDWKEGLDLGAQDGSLDKKGLDGWNQWPQPTDLPRFQEVFRAYFAAMQVLSARLVAAMAVGMELPANFFGPHFDGCDTSFIRFNRYPPCPDPDQHKCISHHTDSGALTVLSQTDVQSLQVWKGDVANSNPVEGKGQWYDVVPRGTDCFVINTGDIAQVWSNDVFRASLHQVKAQLSQERFSIPFFYNPSYETVYQPVAFLGTTGPRYRPINWGAFRMGRFAGDYADVGEDTQISHYRI